MSLIHWWPLNGDLQDKIQGKIFNNGGWTSASSGKIGTTYNANIGAVLSASLSIPNTFSFACWVKNNDLTYPQAPLPMKFSNGAPYSTASASNKGWEFSHGNNSKLTLNNGSTAQELNFGTPHVSYLGSWYHLVFTVDCHLKKASLFINGELIGEKSFTITDFSGTYTFSLGQIHGWKLDGFVNDIRIYDHTLSQAEVKELSKALVVHYTFDDVCAEPTTNLLPLGQQTQSNTAATIEATSGLVNGATYTLSTYVTREPACTSTNPRLTLRFFYSDGTSTAISKYNDGGASYPKDGIERYYFITATANPAKTLTAVGGWLMDHSSGSGKKMTATRSQLEIKDHPTPYTPTTRESMLVNEAGYNYDIDNCGVILSKDAVKGSYSSYYKNGEQYLISKNTPVNNEIISTSVWFKSTNTSPKTDYHIVLAIDGGVVEISIPRNGQLRWGGYTSNSGRVCNNITVKNSSDSTFSLLNGNWHLINTIYDGSGWHAYVDGVYQTKWNATGTISYSNKNLIIGKYNEGTTSNYGATDAYIDDVKIYNTILTSEDIQDLYKTKAYITDKNDIMCGEFIEDKTDAQVTEKGIFECNETQEKPSIPGFELLDGILIEKNPYFDTGLVFGDVNTSIYVDAEVTPTGTSGNNCLAGSGNGGWNGPIMLNFCGGQMEFGTSGYSTSTEPQGKFAANERLTVQAEIYLSTQKWYKNNVQINNITQRTKTATTATFAIGTFKTPSSTVGAAHSFKGYIHRFYVKYGDEVRCYLPAKRKSDNVYGLYDIHTKTFLVNSGGGTVSGTSSTLCDGAAIYQDGRISGREIIEL